MPSLALVLFYRDLSACQKYKQLGCRESGCPALPIQANNKRLEARPSLAGTSPPMCSPLEGPLSSWLLGGNLPGRMSGLGALPPPARLKPFWRFRLWDKAGVLKRLGPATARCRRRTPACSACDRRRKRAGSTVISSAQQCAQNATGPTEPYQARTFAGSTSSM